MSYIFDKVLNKYEKVQEEVIQGEETHLTEEIIPDKGDKDGDE